MADLWNIQSNLNRGELDPLLVGRSDLQAYYNGVEDATNCLCMPQGGMKKRPGTEYLDNPGVADGRLENFSFNLEQNYTLLFVHQKIYIYKDGVRQTNINGTGLDYISAVYFTYDRIAVFDYAQTVDTAIITFPDYYPLTLTRTSDTTWTLAFAVITNIPQYDYNDASSPTPVAEVQRLTFTNANEGDRYKLSLEGVLTEDIAFAGTDIDNMVNIGKALQDLPNTPNSGIFVLMITPLSVYDVYFAGDSCGDWGLLTGTPVATLNANFQITMIVGIIGTSRKEDVWSVGRGWPATCTFHEGRLWFGGSQSRPATIWASRSFDFFNFDLGNGLDDNAIEFTLDTDQVNAVKAIFSNRTLQIFTSGAEFYVPESPITPSSISVTPQSNFGTTRVRPVTIDGTTIFPQRTGKAILQFEYSDTVQANQSKNISVTASHLINSPIKLAVSKGTEATDANYVYILNDDGTLTVYNSLILEDVQGFTPWIAAEDSTDVGKILSIAVTDDTLYMYVRRLKQGFPVYCLERENTDFYTDATVVDTSNDDEITGLDHLEGETVWAKADGAFLGEFTVSSGTITLDRTSDDKEAGLAYTSTITTMPLNVQLKKGPNAAAKKKIARVSLRRYESNGLLVNGERLPDRTIALDQFDAPDPQTDLVRIHLLGWSLNAQVTITQTTPMPMTILNIGTEIAA